MTERKYKVRFLPLFETDLTEIVDYILYNLENPYAANLLDFKKIFFNFEVKKRINYEPKVLQRAKNVYKGFLNILIGILLVLRFPDG